MKSAWVLVVLVPALLAPLASAADATTGGTSDIAFYGHVFGIGRSSPMPMNTQFPYGESDLSQGIVGHTCGVAPPPAGVSCADDPNNEEWLYTTAGFVQIKNQADFNYTKLHNERGLTQDTQLDKSKDITATFYMSADDHGWPLILCQPGAPHDVPWPVPCWNWDPGFLYQWQVEATVYTGKLGSYGGLADTPPDMVEAVADGKLKVLADGVSAPQDVKSLEATGNPTVWRFDIDLGKPQRDVIPKEESYVVRFKWWSVKPDGSHRVLPEADQWNVDSGEYYPPVVHLPVKNAFNVEYVIPQFVYGRLVVLGIMNTPWGSYDVNQDSIQLTVKDKDGNAVTPQHLTRLADFSVAHGGHYKPVNVTYVWDYRLDKLPPGSYSVTVRATNFQGSASASCSGTFVVLAGEAPGDITVGQCGARTITDQQLQSAQQGSATDAGKGGGVPGTVVALHVVAAGAAEARDVPSVAWHVAGIALLAAWRRRR
jgi:hypothetical protein